MAPHAPTRVGAFKLLKQYNSTDRAIKHALAVAAEIGLAGEAG